MRSLTCLIVLFGLSVFGTLLAETNPEWYAVEVSATVQTSPATINLSWKADINATGYTVSRKAFSATSWTSLASLGGTATTYSDSNVAVGSAYEYRLTKTTSIGYQGTGYIYAGINAPLTESRGKVILVVDNTWTSQLVSELNRLQQDLTGDGWIVIRKDVSPSATVPSIKNLIKTEYAADPTNVKAVFLFGHIPVPYSGSFGPDAHPDHQGAWPADAYYGDMDGVWTDSSVNNTSAGRSANWNVPGDGKFDQSDLPSDVELAVGRVDLSNLTCFSNKAPSRTELDLLRQYLNKDHNFRHGLINLPRRGLICDNFGERSGEAFAASGWRSFAPFFGADKDVQVPYGNYFDGQLPDGYLWSYGTGGGSYTSCDGIAVSDAFAVYDLKSVFTMFLGSYFGDWDTESNFMRAALGGTTYTLTSSWAGRPHWFYHHMGLGETIGYSTLISQNNKSGGLYGAQNYGTHQVHIALMGDPTLRMHPVMPVSNLSATANSTGVNLAWTASSDSAIVGYHVYRASSASGPFTRVTGSTPITTLSFTDATGNAGYTYMVRAIKLETSGSGTYYNGSEGIFATPTGSSGGGTITIATPTGLNASAISSSQINISWTDAANNETGYKIFRKSGAGTYAQIALTGANMTSYADSGLAPGTSYTYKVIATNGSVDSAASNESTATTLGSTSTAAATFVKSDTSTLGTWKGVYGTDGYNVQGDSASYPAYVQVTPGANSYWTWAYSSTETRCLQKAMIADRIAACAYSSTEASYTLNFTDGVTHRFAAYFLDWDNAGRTQTIEIADATTGAVLDSRALSNFGNGAYLVWDLKGKVVFRAKRVAGPNAVIAGLFFNAPAVAPIVQTVATPVINPNGGAFNNSASVTITCATSGATIRYTIDGTTPTASSPIYAGAFSLTKSATVKAAAFSSGMNDSAVASASFTITVTGSPGGARYMGVDTINQGNWRGVYGGSGYTLCSDMTRLPWWANVTFSGKNDSVWVNSTTDTRALQRSDVSDRVAAKWSSQTSFDIDINIADGICPIIGIYTVDWDRLNRSQSVEVIDATSGRVLDSRMISAFSTGYYLRWSVCGHIIIRFTNMSSSDAVVSGLFLN